MPSYSAKTVARTLYDVSSSVLIVFFLWGHLHWIAGATAAVLLSGLMGARIAMEWRIVKLDREIEKLIWDEEVERRYGCKCDTLAHKLTGDGCDECNPELAAELEEPEIDEGHVGTYPIPEEEDDDD